MGLDIARHALMHAAAGPGLMTETQNMVGWIYNCWRHGRLHLWASCFAVTVQAGICGGQMWQTEKGPEPVVGIVRMITCARCQDSNLLLGVRMNMNET